MEKVESINYKNHTINIYCDELTESPREWDNLGTMICFHRQYNLGDKHEYKHPRNLIYDLAMKNLGAYEDDKAQEKIEVDWEYLSDKEFIDKYLRLLENKIVILPVYLYDHSGITISTSPFSCPWDSGQVGWIYAKREKTLRWFNKKKLTKKLKEQVVESLVGEIEVYDQQLTGDTYYYEIDDNLGGCGGFYGHNWKENGLLDNAQSDIDYIEKSRIKKHTKDLKAWIKNHVPLQYRKPLSSYSFKTC